MTYNMESKLTESAVERLAGCDNPRTRQLLEAVIRHLHALVREIEPTPEEWLEAIRFLTATGQKCDEQRQEFILLSDVLGVSMLVDAINHRKPAGATESSVLGPFYMEGAPEYDCGCDLAPEEEDKVTVAGMVRGTDGRPVPNALLDIWQTAPDGRYHMQDASQQEFHLCGRIHADADGRYTFSTVKPVSYPVPTDGPVGSLLRASGRHAMRPAHIHFIVSAPGYERLVTQLFTQGDEYIGSDAVFGVKESLIVPYREDGTDAGGHTRYRVDFNFVLEPSAG